MNIVRLTKIGMLALLLCSSYAVAKKPEKGKQQALSGPRVTIGVGTGTVGEPTLDVPIPMTYEGDGLVVGFQFEIIYDSAQLTADLSGCGGSLGGQTTQCAETIPGKIIVLAFDSTFTSIPSGTLGTLQFDITEAIASKYDLVIQNEAYGDADEGDIPSTGSIDGLVHIRGRRNVVFADSFE